MVANIGFLIRLVVHASKGTVVYDEIVCAVVDKFIQVVVNSVDLLLIRVMYLPY
jgi:hypothetical protein